MSLRFSSPLRFRSGYTLIETLVAVAFLAVAMAVMLQLHAMSLEYGRTQSDRQRHQLVVENMAEQLAAIPYSEFEESAQSLATQAGVALTVDPFESDAKKGIHVTMKIDSLSGPLSHHVWRMEPAK